MTADDLSAPGKRKRAEIGAEKRNVHKAVTCLIERKSIPNLREADKKAVTLAFVRRKSSDRFSDVLQKGGWSSEEVSEALGLNSRREKAKKPLIKPLPELAESVDW
ncbi:uroporphyrinogen decarboxylase [Striga asiatica]|uniref:Uroporphyrinogen decarboxylase n=1 Tax=Striga asiatica TaxID=4170 RepID=A0A5A7QBX4_STRAF|nr:uroporphyrinogen decarboxylase [Striga asiatica]